MLVLFLASAVPTVAAAQSNHDGIFRVAGSDSRAAGGTFTVQRGTGTPPATVRVASRIRRPRATIISSDNANTRYALFVRSERSRECGEALLRMGSDLVLSNSYGHGPTECTNGFELDPTQASRAAALLRIRRMDRSPIGGSLTGTFRPSVRQTRSGGSMEVILTIANPTGAQRVFRFQGGRNRGPRNNRFELTIERDGRSVPPIDAYDFGGLGAYRAVEPGGSGEIRADVSQWGDLSAPGRYVVRCAYTTELSVTGDLGGDLPIWERRFEGEIRFTVAR